MIDTVEMTIDLFNAVKSSKYAFEIDKYYNDLIRKCRDFLCSSRGSTLSPNINLYYIQPIFKMSTSITVNNSDFGITYELTQIREGSYAIVYKYKDTFYNRFYVIKRAKIIGKETFSFQKKI